MDAQNPRTNDPMPGAQEFRKLPAVDSLLRLPEVTPLVDRYGPDLVLQAVRSLLDEAREAIQAGGRAPEFARWPGLIQERSEALAAPTLVQVINATGVIIHTNLGRAPLSPAARKAISRLTQGYTNLEYDLTAGRRGSRYSHARALLRELTGAEDALVVNNNASAVMLVLAAFCRDREVIISRGQLVEIGGGFRIPDVLRQSGARLVEVGTTNRTHRYDFERALGPQTAALMRVHASNFRQLGFVTMPSLQDLVEVAREFVLEDGSHPLVIDDLGSGTLLETQPFGLAPEPTVQESVAAGADLVTFSGDKLLGGPQAGIIVGRASAIAGLRRHPLLRALRVDKMTLAALDATLRSYRRGKALEEIPVWRMIAAPLEALEARATSWRDRLAQDGIVGEVQPGESTVGGGSLPGETLPTRVLALATERPNQLAAQLRAQRPPVIARIQQDRLLFDPRTVLPEEDEALLAAIRHAFAPQP